MRKRIDEKTFIGKRFNMLTVIDAERIFYNGQDRIYVTCQCDCGNMRKLDVYNLKYGKTKSCGCNRTSSIVKFNKTHGEAKTRLHSIWCGIKSRCNNSANQSYSDYGGRGITVCDEWAKSFELFRDWAIATGYSDGLTIDRIDVNDNYTPLNCRWADTTVQNRNQRKRSDNTSGIRGVHPKGEKWWVEIAIGGRNKHIGYFNTLESAAEARRVAELKYWGENPECVEWVESPIKLTQADADNIRQAIASGLRQKDLALQYGISQQSVCDIVHFRTWKNKQ